MAGGFADDAAAFLDGDTRVVPLRALGSLSSLSAASLESLACAAASELTGNFPNSVSQNSTDQPTPSDNEAFAAMCTIIVACARDGGVRTPIDQRKQQLYALGVEDQDLQMKLMPILTQVVPSVEHVLENTNFDFSHVVDVSWRLDYVLRSSSAGSVHEPLYFVQLKLQSPRSCDSGLQTVTFSCSVEELRSLVYRIQEAANEVEKLVAGTPSHLRTSA